MSKTTKTTGRRSAQTGTFEIINRAEQSWLVRILAGLVRLRVELTVFTTLVVTWLLLDTYAAPGVGAWLILGALALTIVAIPPCRRYVARRAWCVYTRHRLRTCLVNSRVMTHEGQVPRMLWSRPIPVGVRIWVLLRAGLSGGHVERVTDEIAAACLAREARVHVHDKWTAFVRIDVVRHDPLSSKAVVASDLLTGRETTTTSDSGTGVIPLPDRTTVSPESGAAGAPVTTNITSDAPIARRGKTRTTTPISTAHGDAVAMGRSGEDVSDYV